MVIRRIEGWGKEISVLAVEGGGFVNSCLLMGDAIVVDGGVFLMVVLGMKLIMGLYKRFLYGRLIS